MKFTYLTLFILPIYICFSKPISFDFKDPKGVNSILFHLDAPLESISGSGDDISGEVIFDPSAPSTCRGEITLGAKSLHVGNPLLKEHMHGDDWLQVEKYPHIKFSFNGIKEIKEDAKSLTGVANGKLTIRNTTMAIPVSVKISFLKGMLEKRNRVPGDLLVVRSKFVVKRDDFNIQKGKNLDKVANDIEIILNLAGSAPSK